MWRIEEEWNKIDNKTKKRQTIWCGHGCSYSAPLGGSVREQQSDTAQTSPGCDWISHMSRGQMLPTSML